MPTVREDVAFGPLNLGCSRGEVEDRVHEALPRVRMSEHADRAPHQLSLGQRRRVAIATVLAMHPSLLVLDEPSANLDPRTRRELIETLDAVERTMLVVTHDLPLAARLCERAVLLSGGRDRRRRARATSSCATRSCSPRTTSSCRRASTSPASSAARARPPWSSRPSGTRELQSVSAQFRQRPWIGK